MRLLIALLAVTLATAVIACGGDDDDASTAAPTSTQTSATSASATPTARATSAPAQTSAPTATLAPGVICGATDLAAAVAGVGVAAGTSYYELGLTNTGAATCRLPGRPTIFFLDSNNDPLNDVIINYMGAPCGTGAVDPTVCIDDRPIDLAPGAPTPNGGAPGQVTVTVAIANAGNFNPQPTPTFEAYSIGVKFIGINGIVIPFAPPVTLIPEGQVRLHGYGASNAP